MNKLKYHFLGGLVFLGTIVFGYIGYTAYTNLANQVDGATITKDIWNDVINTINNIGSKTDGIYSSGGNIGIGINNPTGKLNINSIEGANSISMRNSSNGNSRNFRLQRDGTTANNLYLNNTDYNGDVVTFKANGKVGIGTITPSEKLDIGGGNIKMGYEIVNDSRVPGTGAATYNVYCPAGKYLLSASVRTVGGWIEVAHDNLWNGVLVLCDGSQFNTQIQSGVYTTLICANIR